VCFPRFHEKKLKVFFSVFVFKILEFVSITVKMEHNHGVKFTVSPKRIAEIKKRLDDPESYSKFKKELKQIVRETATATESMTVKKSDASMPKHVDSNTKSVKGSDNATVLKDAPPKSDPSMSILVDSNTKSVKGSDNAPVSKDAPSKSVCDKVESSKTTVSNVNRFRTFWTIWWWVSRIKLFVTIVYSIYMIMQNTSMEDISSSFVDFCTVARSASSETFSFLGKVGEELLIHFGFATRTLPVIQEKVEDSVIQEKVEDYTNSVVKMVLLSCASFAVTLLSNMG
jgi:hydrogenase maturation factor